MKKIGVYGSLKKGSYNYDRFRLSEQNFIGTSEIVGAMYLIGNSYPALAPKGSDLDLIHPLEVYEIEDGLFNVLDGMERGAGYEAHEMTVTIDKEEHNIVVWLAGESIAVGDYNYIVKYPV